MAWQELVGDGWADVLAPAADTITGLGDFLRAEAAAGRGFLPDGDRIFAAFTVPFDEVRVLLVGQDPYPTPGHAVGRCFSVAPDVRPLPKSLHNVFTEYVDDTGNPRPASGDLRPWADQGVLLLNRCLTVRPGAPASHRGRGWEHVTDVAIDALATRGGPLTAVLWGADARSLAPRLEGVPLVTSPHPSPLSAHRGFFGSRPFSRVDAALTDQGAGPLDWRLP